MQSIRSDLDEIWKRVKLCLNDTHTHANGKTLGSRSASSTSSKRSAENQNLSIKVYPILFVFRRSSGLSVHVWKRVPVELKVIVPWRLRNNHFARSGGVSGIWSTCLFSVVVVVRRIGAKAKPTANKYENRKLFVSSVFVNGRSMNEFRLFNCLVIFGWSAFLRFKRRKKNWKIFHLCWRDIAPQSIGFKCK